MSQRCVRVTIRGLVQGVGFRPFLLRLARRGGLSGCARNTGAGVVAEVGGAPEELAVFLDRLRDSAPPRARVEGIEVEPIARVRTGQFVVAESVSGAGAGGEIPTDLAPCADCVRELFDESNRRFRHPFASCTDCGPRYSLLESLPWDRERTTMKRFPQCPACEAEFRNPDDRRFHSQTNCCPDCGPGLRFLGSDGRPGEAGEAALRAAERIIREGGILSLKGVGGFQLIVDARNEEALRRLRDRKRRPAKPLAVLVATLDEARELARFGECEAELLRSPAAPIVLVEARPDNGLAPSIAPGNPEIGVFLPASPLHHLLCRDLGFPVVATSGNRSGEPLCVEEKEAIERLGDIADAFLVHNRPVLRPVDDSVARVVAGERQLLRRARGYALLSLRVRLPARKGSPGPTVLACGAHLKNTVAVNTGSGIIVSPHLGDLDQAEALLLHRRTCRDLPVLAGIRPEVRVVDLHPDFPGRNEEGEPILRTLHVPHHLAHVAACMAEHDLAGPVLGIAWDGAGYGPDGTIWGGEFLVVAESGDFGDGPGACGDPAPSPASECGRFYRRFAHFRKFRLPGGEAAVREPRRSALGLCHGILGDSLFERVDHPVLAPFEERERSLLRQVLAREVASPTTSSVGRLFDAVASLLGLRHEVEFEGQGAMEVEFTARSAEVPAAGDEYLCPLVGSDPLEVDWRPMVEEVLRDLRAGRSPSEIAARFQSGLVESALEVSRRAGIGDVVLTGGCFQNRFLLERLRERLQEEGFRTWLPGAVPPNDGGIAVGQVTVAGWILQTPDISVPRSTHNPTRNADVPRHSR